MAIGVEVDVAELAIRLVEEAAQKGTLTRVRALIQILVESLQLDGAVLWQITEGPDSEPLEQRRLIAAAQYFRGENDLFYHYISMKWWTGQRILTGTEPRIVCSSELNRVCRDPDNADDPDFRFIADFGIRSFATVPIYRGEKPWGALNLYSRDQDVPDATIRSSLRSLVKMIPKLAESIARQAGLELLTDIRKQLVRRSATSSRSEKPWYPPIRDTLQPVVEKIQAAFGALEVSIYFDAMTGGEHRLELMATHWPWPDAVKLTSYRKGEGLTGYCFANKIPVLIPDLGRLAYDDSDGIRMRYKGIEPLINFDVWEEAKRLLPQSKDGAIPPITWMGVPLIDERALGVLRVCGLETGPYYFTEFHKELLLLAADQIAEWYSDRMRVQRIQMENQWLQKVVKGVAGLNHRVHEGLVSDKFPQKRLLTETLNVANDAIPDADSFSIRLAQDKLLRYSEFLGRAWETGTRHEISTRKALTFPLEGPDTDSSGAWVFRNNKVLHVPDVPKSQWTCRPFPGTFSMIIAPVASGSNVFGTMEVRSNERNFFSDNAVQVMELLGRQLGMYIFLADKLRDIRTAQKNLAESLDHQRETFENLTHQLKTPVILATRRSNRLLNNAERRYADLIPEVTALRALCRRAEQVSRNIGLFADLARGATISITPSTLTSDGLISQLKEAVRDHSLLIKPDDHITILMDEPSFSVLDQVIVQVDLRLLDQMMGNLLDNAAKYSFKNSQIGIRGGLARHQQHFSITITNRGDPILPTEARQLMERGSRSDRTRNKEGSGLGLYLVREMLHAHKGFLEIQPTNSNGVTEVRLLLPCLGRN